MYLTQGFVEAWTEETTLDRDRDVSMQLTQKMYQFQTLCRDQTRICCYIYCYFSWNDIDDWYNEGHITIYWKYISTTIVEI